jgi:TPR repeat protein
MMYHLGQGVARDNTQVVFWLRKAAEQGVVAAQNNLGAAYQNGMGVARDDKQAEFWYGKAAKQGNAVAQENLDAMKKR